MTMTKPALAVALVMLATPDVGAQAPDPKAAAAREQAIARLACFEGRWSGEGSIRMGPGEPMRFRQAEDVRRSLAGQALLVEGFATAPGSPQPVHAALGVMTFDDQAQVYRFRAWTYRGQVADADVELVDNGFRWSLATPMGRTRYTASCIGDRWTETGEIQPPTQGAAPISFFEMSLTRGK